MIGGDARVDIPGGRDPYTAKPSRSSPEARAVPLSKTILLILLSALLLGLSVLGWQAYATVTAAHEPATARHVGSTACKECHEDRHASWFRTYHRTMTQQATADAVTGQFDGQVLSAFGGTVRPVERDGGYHFEYLDPASGAVLGSLEVAKTVGSHRYQQYLTKATDSETYYRLHYLWHHAEQRWVHMNAAFLGSDAQSFDANVTLWNIGCIHCHNTGGAPQVSNVAELRARAARGEPIDIQRELRFDTVVAELGISCESCHAKGSDHAERMRSPLARFAARTLDGADPSIVNPKDLPPERSNEVCGACHAGRLPPSPAALDRLMAGGSSFRPGDDLREHFEPLHQGSPVPGNADPHLFSNRFWADGGVRLTAYEYQALEASACATESRAPDYANGPLTCIRCHTMHSGDPAGMLPEANRGDAACIRCHQPIAQDLAKHSGHPVDSAGARCMDCHMPKEVYGVMEIHRTHDIRVPDAAHDLSNGRPNACLNCHTGETGDWAAREQARITGKDWALPAERLDGGPIELADGLVALLASLTELRERLPWLLAALDDDRPAIRRFAWRSLGKLDAALNKRGTPVGLAPLLATFDYTGEPTSRQLVVRSLRAQYAAVAKADWGTPRPQSGLDPAWQLKPEVRESLELLGRSVEKQIDIGE